MTSAAASGLAANFPGSLAAPSPLNFVVEGNDDCHPGRCSLSQWPAVPVRETLLRQCDYKLSSDKQKDDQYREDRCSRDGREG